MIGNPFLIRPTIYEPDNKKEILDSYFENNQKGELCGFYLDTRDFRENWLDIVGIQLQHTDFYKGMCTEFEREEEELRAELKRAGIDQVLNRINAQLEAFSYLKMREGGNKE